VADVRAATPTAAAELVAPRLTDLLDWLAQQAGRAQRVTRHTFELARSRLEGTAACQALARPLTGLQQYAQVIDERQQRLRLAAAERFRALRDRLNRADVSILRFRTGARFAQLAQHLEQRMFALRRGVERRVLLGERRLGVKTARLQQVLPARGLARHEEHVDQVRRRMGTTLRQKVAHGKGLLEARMEAVAACDPKRVLGRGYSVTRVAATRRVIRSLAQVKDRLRIITELADGEFSSTAQDPQQPGLFD
jgi:exodeoxyribonuclease VII large subunit